MDEGSVFRALLKQGLDLEVDMIYLMRLLCDVDRKVPVKKQKSKLSFFLECSLEDVRC